MLRIRRMMMALTAGTAICALVGCQSISTSGDYRPANCAMVGSSVFVRPLNRTTEKLASRCALNATVEKSPATEAAGRVLQSMRTNAAYAGSL